MLISHIVILSVICLHITSQVVCGSHVFYRWMQNTRIHTDINLVLPVLLALFLLVFLTSLVVIPLWMLLVKLLSPVLARFLLLVIFLSDYWRFFHMMEKIKYWFKGLKVPLGVYILAFFLVLSFIAVSCQGLFNVNASDSEVTLVDSLKGGSNET